MNSLEKRKTFGFMWTKRNQFRAAMSCSGLLLIPSLTASVYLVSQLALEINRLAQLGTSSALIAESAVKMAYVDCWLIVGVFSFFAAASFILSLRLSNQVTGPVQRMENHVRKLTNDDYSVTTTLRKGDYLLPLARLLNGLSAHLKNKRSDGK